MNPVQTSKQLKAVQSFDQFDALLIDCWYIINSQLFFIVSVPEKAQELLKHVVLVQK